MRRQPQKRFRTAFINIKYRPDIDGLRAIAVTAVVLFHAFPSVFRSGFIGVDIFFVISGYLISTIILKRLKDSSFTIKEFYQRRVLRIFPVFLITMACCLCYGFLFLIPSDLKLLSKHFLGGLGFISNFTLLSEANYFDVSSDLKPLLHLWSLSIEEQFYIIWPLILAWSYVSKKRVALSVSSFVVFSFLLNFYFNSTDAGFNFYFPLTRFWEISLGSALACIEIFRPRVDSESRSETLSILGFILLLSGFFLISPKHSYPGAWALLPVLGTVFIISAGQDTFLNRKFLSWKILVKIGLFSYPLYLVHWPLLSFAYISKGEQPSFKYRIFAFVISYFLSWVLFRYIEIPLRRLKISESKKVQFLLAFSLVLGGFGAFIFFSNGAPSRFPNEIRKLTTLTNPYDYFDFYKYTRLGLCHNIPQDVSLLKIKANCIEKNKPLVFLWGDSYAASLYPGLKKLQAVNKFGIAQYTAGEAPPFFGVTRQADNNRSVQSLSLEALEIIKETRPGIVLLTWMHITKSSPNNSFALKEITNTIIKVKNTSPSSRIIVIGPVPRWKVSLPGSMIKFWQSTRKVPPVYMDYRLDKRIFHWDEELKRTVILNNAEYLSALSLLCQNEKCLTRLGEDLSDIVSIDYGHISPKASEFLMMKFEKEIFK